mmetsp:Transcript_56184/g.119612  ORF Transcript_56184/g.119612 Transcript_56184/m.119612 type:complete len:325 (+) Transcript_56184:299-1273(+)
MISSFFFVWASTSARISWTICCTSSFALDISSREVSASFLYCSMLSKAAASATLAFSSAAFAAVSEALASSRALASDSRSVLIISNSFFNSSNSFWSADFASSDSFKASAALAASSLAAFNSPSSTVGAGEAAGGDGSPAAGEGEGLAATWLLSSSSSSSEKKPAEALRPAILGTALALGFAFAPAFESETLEPFEPRGELVGEAWRLPCRLPAGLGPRLPAGEGLGLRLPGGPTGARMLILGGPLLTAGDLGPPGAGDLMAGDFGPPAADFIAGDFMAGLLPPGALPAPAFAAALAGGPPGAFLIAACFWFWFLLWLFLLCFC